jgi:hypothetical protein
MPMNCKDVDAGDKAGHAELPRRAPDAAQRVSGALLIRQL